MSVDAVSAVGGEWISRPVELVQSGSGQTGAAPATFLDWVGQEIRSTNASIVNADDGVRRMAAGDPVNLHEVMLDLDHARLRFEFLLQIRNRFMDAYQELVRTQI
jgi:flagellar hook-basal body complex protein FliE